MGHNSFAHQHLFVKVSEQIKSILNIYFKKFSKLLMEFLETLPMRNFDWQSNYTHELAMGKGCLNVDTKKLLAFNLLLVGTSGLIHD